MCNCSKNRGSINTRVIKPQINNNNIQLKSIWGRVILHDGEAKNELIRMYLNKFPNNRRLTLDKSIDNLHKLYIQLANS